MQKRKSNNNNNNNDDNNSNNDNNNNNNNIFQFIFNFKGIIRDFAGPYLVTEDNMAFGNPTR